MSDLSLTLPVSVSNQALITKLYLEKQIRVFSVVDKAIQRYMKDVLRITEPIISNYESEGAMMRLYLNRDAPSCLSLVFCVTFDGANTRVVYGRAPKIQILHARDMYSVSLQNQSQVFKNPRTSRDDTIRYLVQCFVTVACDA